MALELIPFTVSPPAEEAGHLLREGIAIGRPLLLGEFEQVVKELADNGIADGPNVRIYHRDTANEKVPYLHIIAPPELRQDGVAPMLGRTTLRQLVHTYQTGNYPALEDERYMKFQQGSVSPDNLGRFFVNLRLTRESYRNARRDGNQVLKLIGAACGIDDIGLELTHFNFPIASVNLGNGMRAESKKLAQRIMDIITEPLAETTVRFGSVGYAAAPYEQK